MKTGYPLILTVVGVGFLILWVAALLFERRQRRRGRWNADGPLHPTKGYTAGDEIAAAESGSRAARRLRGQGRGPLV